MPPEEQSSEQRLNVYMEIVGHTGTVYVYDYTDLQNLPVLWAQWHSAVPHSSQVVMPLMTLPRGAGAGTS